MILAFLNTYRPWFVEIVPPGAGTGNVQRVYLLEALVGSIKGPFQSSGAAL